ncbi:Wzz/FepE/Etk N-terminal domain-containing protein [Priestia aryabhattai]|uniref:YveK family protein n=1 Tax=Priestia TaxID=2800373 RepID=UPI002E20F0D0|nr:Wzz/FepE/Etk N-terminal domain-containing protein [Priestia aryabhattai]MED3960181.1 Wzz/FepE/Etk N-terminal domain-containing protein [Priestia aryabhattai]MED3992456.1 Wzz/FepE/Etk N-terminal domain-containing protein [Priestia aryabhattai]MED4008603.1 Wzz/FepE/Etk N-terminal domain-containing protein [Priestia aryabhattai]
MSTLQEKNFLHQQKGKDINLKEYYEVIKKRIWLIIIVTIFTTLAGFFYSHQNNTTVYYQASTRVVVDVDTQKMSTLLVMVKDPIVMGKVTKQLNLEQPAEATAGQVQAASLNESQIISLSATSTDPITAVKIANTTAEVFKEEVGNILNIKGVQLLSPAKNSSPIDGNQNRTIMLALIAGIVIGLGLTFLLDSLDGRVKKDSEVEQLLGVPVIGTISNMNKQKFKSSAKIGTDVELRSETVGSK